MLLKIKSTKTQMLLDICCQIIWRGLNWKW